MGTMKGEGKSFLNREAQTYPLNYLLYVGVMLTLIGVHHPILILSVGTENILTNFKTNK